MPELNIKNEEVNDKPKVDLSSIEEVRLDNKHRYIKYFDLNKNKPVMLRIDIGNNSTKEIIEGIQRGSISFNSSDALNNTMGILEMEAKRTRVNLTIIPISEMETLPLESLNKDQLAFIKIIVKNKESYIPKLKFINLEELLVIDENNLVKPNKLIYTIRAEYKDFLNTYNVSMYEGVCVVQNINIPVDGYGY